MTWLDARVKFIGDSAVVELRLPSMRPTIGEEMVLLLLYVGRLHYSQITNQPLLSINMVRENRLAAMLHGTKKTMWFLNRCAEPVKLPANRGLLAEIEKAKRGLDMLGILSSLDDKLLNEILRIGPPSDRIADKLTRRRQHNFSFENMENALKETDMLLT